MEKRLIIVLALCSLGFISPAQDAAVLKGDALNAELQEHYGDAATYFDAAAKAYKAQNIIDTLCIYRAGVNYVKIKKYKEAIPFLQESLDMNWNSGYTSRLLAEAYAGIQKPDTAEQILIAGKEKVPEEAPEFDRRLAYLYFNSGQYEKARTSFEKLITLSPGGKDYLFLYGFSLERTKEYEKAVAVFEKMQLLFPDDKESGKMLAISYFEQTDDLNEKEVKRYNSLKNAKLEDYIGTRKRLEEIDVRYEKARIMLEQSHKDFPTDQIVINLLYKVYKKQNNTTGMSEMKKLMK